MDADLSHDPKYLPAMIAAAAAGADLVIGSRYLQRHQRRELAAAPHHPQLVRQLLHPHGHRPAHARHHHRLSLLAPRRRSPSCRSIASSPTATRSCSTSRSWPPTPACGSSSRRSSSSSGAMGASKLSSGVLIESLFTPWKLIMRHGRIKPRPVGGIASKVARDAQGLSVFFPAYNDAGTIASLVITAVKVAATLTDDYEVHRHQRRQPGRHRADPRRAGADLSRSTCASSITRRIAATAARCARASRTATQGLGLLHRRRRRSTIRPR